MLKKRAFSDQLSLYAGYGVTVLSMWFLKSHYSRASAESLNWMLGPVASLVHLLDGFSYDWYSGIGWVRSDGFITIAPACAGVNFMIMLFGLGCGVFLHRLKSGAHRLVWLVVIAATAYLFAVGVNSLRIVLSIFLFEHHLSWGWLTPERLHRVMGVAIYFPALGLFYLFCQCIIDKIYDVPHTKRMLSLPFPWQPLIWYVTGTVAVPLIHNIYRGGFGLSAEYVITVIGVSLLVWGSGAMGWNLFRKR